jgi:preprotein translocase subunit SecA
VVEPAAPVVEPAAETVTPAAPQPPAAEPPARTEPLARNVLPEGFGRPERQQGLSYSAPNAEGGVTSSGPAVPDPLTGQVTSGGPSRNAPCPCGSGRKYKRCHGDPSRKP